MSAILTVITACASVAVLWYCVCSINHMTRATPFGLRFSVACMASGAFAELLGIVAGYFPDLPETLMLCGLLAMVINNCRLAVCPCMTFPPCRPGRDSHDYPH